MDHSHHFAPPRSASGARRRPRWLAALVAVVAALFLAGGLAVPAQAAAATTTLAVSASDYSVSSGASVTVTGTLKRGSKAVAGVYVTLQKRTAGSSKWTTVKKAKTSSKGKVSAKVSGLTKNTEIRAVFSGTSKYKASKSSTKKVSVTQKASIGSTSTTKPTKGGTIWLKGTTTSGLAGKTVQLQKKSGSSWTKVSSATVSAKNGFYLSTTAGNAGKATYRVYAPSTASTKSATSAEKAFTVYQWFNLNDAEPYFGTVWDDDFVGLLPGAGQVAGTAYTNGLSDYFSEGNTGFEPAYSLWNLKKSCTTFTAKVGIDDDSAAGTSAGFFGYGYFPEGPNASDREFAFGSATRGTAAKSVTANLAGVQYFQLWAEDTTATPWADPAEGYPVFIDSKVLCSSNPAA